MFMTCYYRFNFILLIMIINNIFQHIIIVFASVPTMINKIVMTKYKYILYIIILVILLQILNYPLSHLVNLLCVIKIIIT